jgi:phosphate transport system substrate-binding protein
MTSKILTTASALVLALIAQTTTAVAQLAPTSVYGGGTDVGAEWFRQAADCFGNKSNLVVRGADSVAIADFFPVTVTSGIIHCSLTQVATIGVNVRSISSTSARGINAIFGNSPTVLGPYSPGIAEFPKVHFALSDAPLSATDIANYDVAGAAVGAGGAVVPVGGNTAKFGKLIQVPTLVMPVTIAYDPVYKKVLNADGSITEYRFNLKTLPARATSGGLRLDKPTYCKIFTGQITNWNAPELKAINRASATGAAVSLRDPADPTSEANWSVPLQIVGRSDSTAVTAFWTRHLSSVCGGTLVEGGTNPYNNATFSIPGTTSAITRDLQGAFYNKSKINSAANSLYTLPNYLTVALEESGKYTLADGNDGVAKYIDHTAKPTVAGEAGARVQGRIGYIAPDHVLPSVTSTQFNSFGLFTADLKNNAGKFVAPTPAAAQAPFSKILPPQSLAGGGFTATPAPGSLGFRNKPADWVQAIDRTAKIASPEGTVLASYPIVGTINLLAYTCYGDRTVRNAFTGFWNWLNVSGTASGVLPANPGIFARAGYGVMPTNWRNAVSQTFYKTVPATDTLGLFIVKNPTTAAGLTATNPSCVGKPGA